MPLRLYNTRTRAVEPLKPLEPDHVRVYVCGLTPSAEAHLGHARSFLFFDVLRRYLEHPRNGWRVTYVQNVTDIDDRSIATAQLEGTTFDVVVARYYAAFKEAMRVLNVREPDSEPYATKYVPQIIEMIGELIERGYAYVAQDGVYYAVETFPRYGELSGKKIDELRIGARIAENEHKADPLDFALWKFAKPGEPQWASPWGSGRPGWHIECSAMSRALLGVPFDLHGGGYDLIFPHHENEIAQSEPLMAKPPMAEMWVHGGLLNFENRKMSKSLGNFEPLTELLKRHDPFAIRLLFLQTGYRKPMNFTEESIAGATSALRRLQRGAREMRRSVVGRPLEKELLRPRLDDAEREFFNALDDDMDTSRALAVLFSLDIRSRSFASAGMGADALAKFRAFADVLGLRPAFAEDQLIEVDKQVRLSADFVDRVVLQFPGILPPVHPDVVEGIDPAQVIDKVIAARTAARTAKDFALGDRLRDALAAEGIVLKDSKDGTTWTVAGA